MARPTGAPVDPERARRTSTIRTSPVPDTVAELVTAAAERLAAAARRRRASTPSS